MKAKHSLWRWICMVSFLLTIAINGYANYAKLNGVTTAEVSDTFQVYFVPAGYVFSIWGVIYLFLILFLIYQFTPSQKEDERFLKIAPYFVVTNIANAVWLILFHYQQHYFTILPMLILLFALIKIYTYLHEKTGTQKDKFFVDLPFSIYLGWVSVATIANMTQFLDYVGWSGFGLSDEFWLVIVLALAVVLSFLMSKKFHDLAYSLVLVWAFIGIGFKFSGNPVVELSSYIAAGLVVLLYFLTFEKKK
jgi:hypothetical protein